MLLGVITGFVLDLLGQELLEGVEDASIRDDHGGVHLNLLSSLQHSNTWPNAHAHTHTHTHTQTHTHTHTQC